MKGKLLSLVLLLVSAPIFAQYACGSFFLDPGDNGNYPNNSNSTIIICPNLPGDQVYVTFDSFDVEAGYDGLYVFDGNSETAPQISSGNPAGSIPGGLSGAFWGTNIPGPFISTSPNGCLTFRFVSNGTITSAGWVANIICGPPAECTLPPSSVFVSNITSSSVALDWSGTGMALSWEVLALPCGSPAPTAETPGILTNVHPFVFSGLTPGTCYDFYVRSMCNPEYDFSPWTTPTTVTTTSGVAIGLTAFIDQNNNGTKETDEPIFNYGSYVIQENDSGDPTNVSVSSGIYSFDVANFENTYDLSYSVNPEFTAYFDSETVHSNVSVEENSGLNMFYFPITVVTPYNDLSVLLVPMSSLQPGFPFGNKVIYRNLGQTQMSGTLTFTKDPVLSITNVTPAGSVANTDGFSFAFTDLQPNETRELIVMCLSPTIPTVSLGDVLTNSVSISSPTSEISLLNNTSSHSQAIIGSYDPNDIAESHGPQIVHAEFDQDEYLYYTIRFQNTGTANATTVRVENQLDEQLDSSTFQMLYSSHDYTMTRVGEELIWQFDDIQLVPEATDSEDSQGFIQYKIKPTTGYAIGDIIPNMAEIYFDFNPPIITDTFETEFVQQLANVGFESDNLQLYPNPARQSIMISGEFDAISSVTIHDLLGKAIYTQSNIGNSDASVDVSKFSRGIYLVTITTSDNLKIVKKLIVR